MAPGAPLILIFPPPPKWHVLSSRSTGRAVKSIPKGEQLSVTWFWPFQQGHDQLYQFTTWAPGTRQFWFYPERGGPGRTFRY